MPTSPNTPAFKASPNSSAKILDTRNNLVEKAKEEIRDRTILTWNGILEAILTEKEYKSLTGQQGVKQETIISTSIEENEISIRNRKEVTAGFIVNATMEAGASTPIPVFNVTIRRPSPGPNDTESFFELRGDFGGENTKTRKVRYTHPNQNFADAINNNVHVLFAQLSIRDLRDKEIPIWDAQKKPTPLSQHILIQIENYNDEWLPLYIFMLPDNVGTSDFIKAEVGGRPITIVDWSEYLPFKIDTEYFVRNNQQYHEEIYEKMRHIIVTNDDIKQ